MQPADNVQLRDAQRQRFARLLNDFVRGQLETVLVALLAREGAELAAQDAVVRVVDVAVDDVAGAAAVLALVYKVGDGADRIEVFALEQPQGVGFGNPLAGHDLVVNVAQLAALYEEVHEQQLTAKAVLGKGSLTADERKWTRMQKAERPVELVKCGHSVFRES